MKQKKMQKKLLVRKDAYLQKKDNNLFMSYGQYDSIIMEYQKIVNLFDNETNQPSKFRKGNWVEINDESRGTYISTDIKFKTAMLRSNLCDYADAYILD